MKRAFFIISLAFACFSGPSFAEDTAKGKAVYEKRCAWCHGKEGAGDGPAAAFLNPPPRDFTLGMYKWKSTPYDEYFPSEDDFYRMVAGMNSHNRIPGWNGMNSTSMPGWDDTLSSAEIKDAVAYIKTFANLTKAEKPSISASNGVSATKDSIERGRKLFEDRCTECHGMEGRGDASKKLKDDWGARTWPRNLTKGWTYRAGSSAKDIYTRITAGITGTQMPSFNDPRSKKILTDAERWDVANFVATLDKPYKKPGDSDVIGAMRVEGALPEGPLDPLWEKAAYTSFYTAPQLIAGERHFTPTIDSLSVKALYNEKEIAFLVEWDDPTRSMPWDEKAIGLADGEIYEDGAAIQMPLKAETKPYFGMGDEKPVEIWMWKSEQALDAQQTVKAMNTKGFKAIEEKGGALLGLRASGVYEKGAWRVVFKRPLKTEDAGRDAQLTEGSMIPIALAAWDGSNHEKGSKHVLTTWHWVSLARKEEGVSHYIWAIAIGALFLVGELIWLGSGRKKD